MFNRRQELYAAASQMLACSSARRRGSPCDSRVLGEEAPFSRLLVKGCLQEGCRRIDRPESEHARTAPIRMLLRPPCGAMDMATRLLLAYSLPCMFDILKKAVAKSRGRKASRKSDAADGACGPSPFARSWRFHVSPDRVLACLVLCDFCPGRFWSGCARLKVSRVACQNL